MVTQIQSTFERSRNIGTPIVSVSTFNPATTIEALKPHCNWIDEKPGDVPIAIWDIVKGMRPANPEGKVLTPDGGDGSDYDGVLGFKEMLADLSAPGKVTEFVVFAIFANRILADDGVVTAIYSVRDIFKARGQTLVMLGPDFKLPAELSQDVLPLDEALPDAEWLGNKAREVYEAIGQEPTDEEIAKAVEGLIGLAAFPAEQAAFMAARPEGIDFAELWERKRKVIEQTPGLSIYRGTETLDSVAGYEHLKDFFSKLFTGKNAPAVIVFIDEIEKAMAGIAGDNTGVSQDFLGEQLKFMQDTGAKGLIELGPPGTGKSAIAKAAGNTFGIPTIELDLGGMKESLVGASESNLRRALKVIETVSGGRALFVATSNDVGILPSALIRRYKYGLWFLDLPTADERVAIWDIWLERYGLEQDPVIGFDDNWTGSDIQTCCDLADSLGCSLEEASKFFVPVHQTSREDIARLRAEANNRYMSASTPGPYEAPTGTPELETFQTPGARRARIN